MTHTHRIAALLLLSSTLCAPAALAQDGYVGLTFGDYTKEDDDSGDFDGRSTTLDGLYRWTLGSGAIVLEGSHRGDNIDDDALFGTEMTTQSHVAAHYIHSLGTAATVSGFVGYGVAPHDEDDEDYALVYGGIGGSYAASPTFTVYGQLGIGDAPNEDDTDSSGFASGEFARIGVSFTGIQGTELSLEWERAFSDRYEDEGESGSFGSLYLGGVTALPSNDAIQITYGARSAFFDAKDDPNRADEVTATLGVRFVLGGKAPGDFAREGVLGSPYVPLRASNWTPSLD
jgi:hypothetical protein